MAQTKNALIRQRVIDRCLRSPKQYSIMDMMEYCNVALKQAGYPPKIHDEVFKEILEQAENFKRHSSPRPYSTFTDDSTSIAAEP